MKDPDLWGHRGLVEDSVDAVTDAQIMAQGLEMDVGGPLIESLAQDLVHEFHHGCFRILSIQDVDLLLFGDGFQIPSLEKFLKGFCTHTIG